MSEWRAVPWDRRALGVVSYEARNPSRRAFLRLREGPAHYTVKIDPHRSASELKRRGFYYCDTLWVPYGRRADLPRLEMEGIRLSRPPLQAALKICRGAFRGRFHRDPAVPRALAEKRYENWLRQLHRRGHVFGLYRRGKLAGFIGYDRNRLVLHAMDRRYRGRGWAKYFWAAACRELFRKGYREVTSSVSASNKAARRLYASLGFRFRGPVDVYHRTRLG